MNIFPKMLRYSSVNQLSMLLYVRQHVGVKKNDLLIVDRCYTAGLFGYFIITSQSAAEITQCLHHGLKLPRADVDILTLCTVVMGNNVNPHLAFSLHFQRVRRYQSITAKEKHNPSKKITCLILFHTLNLTNPPGGRNL